MSEVGSSSLAFKAWGTGGNSLFTAFWPACCHLICPLFLFFSSSFNLKVHVRPQLCHCFLSLGVEGPRHCQSSVNAGGWPTPVCIQSAWRSKEMELKGPERKLTSGCCGFNIYHNSKPLKRENFAIKEAALTKTHWHLLKCNIFSSCLLYLTILLGRCID